MKRSPHKRLIELAEYARKAGAVAVRVQLEAVGTLEATFSPAPLFPANERQLGKDIDPEDELYASS